MVWLKFLRWLSVKRLPLDPVIPLGGRANGLRINPGPRTWRLYSTGGHRHSIWLRI